jgi:hemolysin III
MAKNSAKIKVEPNDQGPIYKETDMSRIPVEPWSTWTNLIFLSVFIYYAIKTRFNYKKFPMMVIFLVILLIGWFGGTVYHATRSNNIWLLMDYIPIMIIVLTASIYFWRELVGNWLLVMTFTLVPIMIYRFIFHLLPVPHFVSISIGYTLLASVVVVPLIPHCIHKTPEGWKMLVISLVSFGLAISCRLLDNQQIVGRPSLPQFFQDHFGWIEDIPMGTHFLWHIFGGICCLCMFSYVFNAEKKKQLEEKAENNAAGSSK